MSNTEAIHSGVTRTEFFVVRKEYHGAALSKRMYFLKGNTLASQISCHVCFYAGMHGRAVLHTPNLEIGFARVEPLRMRVQNFPICVT